MGGMFEGKRWVLPAESLRMLIVAVTFFFLFRESGLFIPVAVVAVLLAMISTVWLWKYRMPVP
jgi:multisubunit Na+/H+ antiporter MnhF subunit